MSLAEAVKAACSTDADAAERRQAERDRIVEQINNKTLKLLDLTLALGELFASTLQEEREHATRLVGEVVARAWAGLTYEEAQLLAQFLAGRLRDWPCVGAASAACLPLLRHPRGAAGSSSSGPGLSDAAAVEVLEALGEALRSTQVFKQEDRSALLQLLLAACRPSAGPAAPNAAAASAGAGAAGAGAAGSGAGGSWGALAASRGINLLDAFLGAADGEKDPRCLLAAFEAVRALCALYHSPGVDPAPLRELADELADWCSAYFPISFNPPPASAASRQRSITRADLAAGLEGALSASPFLAGGVLPLLLEKLSSTYRPAKEDALSALRAVCPAYGPDALAPHLGQLWPALRSEVLAPGGTALGPGAAGGDELEQQVALSAAAAECLAVVVRSAPAGAVEALALQDACVSDLLTVLQRAGSSAASGSGRADRQVLSAARLLGTVAGAAPEAFRRVHGAVVLLVLPLLQDALAAADPRDRCDQILYAIAVLTVVLDAVAAHLAAPSAAAAAWRRAGAEAAAAVGELAAVRDAVVGALGSLHVLLRGGRAGARGDSVSPMEVDGGGVQEGPVFSDDEAVQLQLVAVAAWRAMLRLGAAAAATGDGTGAGAPGSATGAGGAAVSPLAPLLPSAEQLAAAAEQLCGCALGGGGGVERPTGQSVHCRTAWGRSLDAEGEAAAALQQLLQLLSALPGGAAGQVQGADASVGGTEGGGRLVGLIVQHVVRPAAALRDSCLGAGAAGQQQPSGCAGGGDAAGDAALRALRLGVSLAGGHPQLAATLLGAVQPLLLSEEGAGPVRQQEEEWHRFVHEALRALSSDLLPSVQRGCSGTTTTSSDAAASAAAHGFASAVLRSPPLGELSHAGVGAGAVGGWCGVVQELVACCTPEQQLDLAMAAAEAITSAAGEAAAAAAAGRGAASPASHPPALPLACAAVAALRPGVLAPESTRALIETLQLLALVPGQPGHGAPDAMEACGGAASSTTASSSAAQATRASGADTVRGAAAVALAAAVNRWGDQGGLDGWVEASFRPLLLARAAALVDGARQDGGSQAAAHAGAGGRLHGEAAAAVVRAVGWVGRGLALRNHPALGEVVATLQGCLRLAPQPSGGGGAGGEAGGMEVDGGAGGADAGSGADAAAAAAAAEAAELFGVLVADAPACCGVSLRGQPTRAVCRVLWQQRTFAQCVQALAGGAAGGAGGRRREAPAELLAAACLAASAPRALCRQEAARLAPLLLRAAQLLCALCSAPAPTSTAASAPAPHAAPGPAAAPAGSGSSGADGGALAAVPAPTLAWALQGCLGVLLDWMEQSIAQQGQLKQVLEDHVAQLASLLCAAARDPRVTPAREQALRCMVALMQAVEYHHLHPLRQQVLQAAVGALDDGKRSVRQLAARVRRVWTST